MENLPHLDPITGICIVADNLRCPPNYEIIKAQGTAEDCDLWKDGLFRSKVRRYLCITRKYPLEGGRVNNVLLDLTLIAERDSVPTGYTALEETIDTREKATQKKIICVKMAPRSVTRDAVSDIQILNRSKRPPPGYQLIGELEKNFLSFCYRIGPVPTENQTLLDPPVSSSDSYLKLKSSSTMSTNQSHNLTNGIVNRQESLTSLFSPICGVPFQLNHKLTDFQLAKKISAPEIHYRSLVDIENEYGYTFTMEKNAASRFPTMLN